MPASSSGANPTSSVVKSDVGDSAQGDDKGQRYQPAVLLSNSKRGAEVGDQANEAQHIRLQKMGWEMFAPGVCWQTRRIHWEKQRGRRSTQI